MQSPVNLLSEDAWVSELIDQALGWWNIPLIHYVFQPAVDATICNLCPSPLNQPDRLVRRRAKNGIFSVRTAYHMEVERRDQ